MRRRRRMMHPRIGDWNVPLMRNLDVIERPAGQTTLARRYTDEAIAFIKANRARPFFLYLAHSMPHVPLFPSKQFEGKSPRGTYGDVIEEIDWNAGRLVEPAADRVLDGHDIGPVLRGSARSPRQTMFFYRGTTLYALRHRSFKAHFVTKSEYGSDPAVAHQPPLLYNLDQDPSEKFDVASKHADVVAEIQRIADDHKKTVKPVENQLRQRL